MSIYLTEPNLFPGLKDMPEEYPESERMESGAYRIGNPDADDIMDNPLRDARRQWERLKYFTEISPESQSFVVWIEPHFTEK